MTETRRIMISRLGAQGDGVADTDDGAVFIPFALAGEQIEAQLDGERGALVRILEASPSRVKPACKHFGPVSDDPERIRSGCGGCAMQHLEAGAYSAWKRGLIEQAFAARGIEVALAPMISVGLGSRRRAILTARRAGRSVLIGFHAAGTHQLVDIDMCPVLAPEIVAALPGLRQLIGPLIEDRAELRITVLRAANGLDVDVSGATTKGSPKLRETLAQQAADLGLLRLSLERDPLYQAAAPFIRCGVAEVVPAPAIFLQASAEAEAAMAAIALKSFGKRAKQAADLFCGLGAFSFVLASKAKVMAIDNDAAAIDALEEAKRKTQGVRGIDARRRDLFQEPLSRKELEPFDLVVFDPPRAGAKAQAEMLAKSKVPVVVAVSCYPATMARDLRILIDGGYRLESVTPIDQFLFTTHVEVTAVLRR